MSSVLIPDESDEDDDPEWIEREQLSWMLVGSGKIWQTSPQIDHFEIGRRIRANKDSLVEIVSILSEMDHDQPF